MNTFQMDLYEPPRIFSDQTYKYILVVIDVVTRFILTYPLKNKKCTVMSDPVPRAMLLVLKDIQKLRIDITTIESDKLLLFYSDLGSEFTNKLMKALLKKYDSILFTLGDSYKAGMCERVIRSIGAIANNMNKQDINFNLFNQLQTVTANYNKKSHSSLPEQMSPIEYLHYLNKNKTALPAPWTVLGSGNMKGSGAFDFDKNYYEIENKISIVKKKLPILSTVKLATTRREFAKGELSERFSRENFYITGFKRPLMHTEPVLIKVSDFNGVELKGVFRENELKLVPAKGILTVTKFIDKVIQKKPKQSYYIVCIETFGETVYFKLSSDELKNFKNTKNALQEKNLLDQKKISVCKYIPDNGKQPCYFCNRKP